MSSQAMGMGFAPGVGRVSALSKVLAVALAVLTVLISGLGVLAGVAWLDAGVTSAVESTTVAVGSEPHIAVHMSLGSLTVEGGPSPNLVLTERETVHALSREVADNALRGLASQVHVASHSVAVDVPSETPALHSVIGPVSQQRDVTLEIPRDSSLQITAGPAAITVADFSGSIDVTAPLGRISVTNFTVSRTSHLEVTNGAIYGNVRMAGGTLVASVVNGGIDLAVASPDGTTLEASTNDGSIELPTSFRVAIQRSGSGQSALGLLASGRGAGGRLMLSAVNGVITLTRR